MSEIGKKLDDLLQHHGVKGMHWGVRHDEHKALNPKDPDAKPPVKIKKHIDSLKRERQWKSVIKDMDNISTKDLHIIKKRVDLENDLKKVSKSKVANKHEKQAYLNRHNMSNEEIQRKVNRVKAKENLHKSIKDASKEQRELGIKIAQTGGSLAVNYAINGGRPTGSKFQIAKGVASDAMTIWEKPKETWDKAEVDALNEVERRNAFAGQASKFLVKQYKSKKAKENKK
jgi:hypothetical protein